MKVLERNTIISEHPVALCYTPCQSCVTPLALKDQYVRPVPSVVTISTPIDPRSTCFFIKQMQTMRMAHGQKTD